MWLAAGRQNEDAEERPHFSCELKERGAQTLSLQELGTCVFEWQDHADVLGPAVEVLGWDVAGSAVQLPSIFLRRRSQRAPQADPAPCRCFCSGERLGSSFHCLEQANAMPASCTEEGEARTAMPAVGVAACGPYCVLSETDLWDLLPQNSS